jgi:hypothetical protein
MRYPDGQDVRVGDVVTIDQNHHGMVVGCVGDGCYLPPQTKEQWGHLGKGILIDTNFGGLVHYPDEAALASEPVVLVKRQHDL